MGNVIIKDLTPTLRNELPRRERRGIEHPNRKSSRGKPRGIGPEEIKWNLTPLFWRGMGNVIIKNLTPTLGGTADLYTSAALAAELRQVLAYPKFAKRLNASGETVDRCTGRFLAIAKLAARATIEGTGIADPDDEHVIACALPAQADLLVSRDTHLLVLKSYQRIPIVTATAALNRGTRDHRRRLRQQPK